MRDRSSRIAPPQVGVTRLARRGARMGGIAAALALTAAFTGPIAGSATAEPARSVWDGVRGPHGGSPLGWRDRLVLSVSAVTTAPLDPFDFASAWGSSSGFGVELQWRTSSRRSIVLDYTHDEFPFDARGYAQVPSILSVEGTDARTDTWLLGYRAHHESGPVLAGATLYVGKRSRQGQRAHVVYTQGEYDIGEKDDTMFAYGFGVRVAGALPGYVPDPFLDARGLWFGDGQIVLPIRAGISIP